MRIAEKFNDYKAVIDSTGKYTSGSLSYVVHEAEDADDAMDGVRSYAPNSINGLYLANVEIEEQIGQNAFKVKVSYDTTRRENSSTDNEETEDEPAFSFDTTGGTRHVTQSLGTVARFPEDAPDFAGAINVDAEGTINGVDIMMPSLKFNETHYFKPSIVTTAFKINLAERTGSVNQNNFRGFYPGELLFAGASGSRRGESKNDYWEINYQFVYSRNSAQLQIGDLIVTNKRGWDYLWCLYEEKKQDNFVVKVPVAAYIEQVYQYSDFGYLGIGN